MHFCMDWRTIDFDWNRARSFLVTAEEGSFSAAARALGIAQPTVGRQVAALEEELGVTLFERVGGGLALTGVGQQLLGHARAMGEAASRLSLAATGAATAVEGTVAITASEAISAHVLPRVLRDLRADHPGIHVLLVAQNASLDLARREADIAVRNTRPTDPDLVARRLADRVGYIYASAEHMAAVGPIRGASDFPRLDFIGFDIGPVTLEGMKRLGLEIRPEQLKLGSANHLVQWEAVKAGLGAGVMMSEVGDATPGVQRVPGIPGIPFPMWLVCHRELHTSRRIRIVFDRLAAAL
jgi:DNA-binding transcriptional LysR family regulator